jgi:hypothetical protein
MLGIEKSAIDSSLEVVNSYHFLLCETLRILCETLCYSFINCYTKLHEEDTKIHEAILVQLPDVTNLTLFSNPADDFLLLHRT